MYLIFNSVKMATPIMDLTKTGTMGLARKDTTGLAMKDMTGLARTDKTHDGFRSVENT
jgi:hypothetical protein